MITIAQLDECVADVLSIVESEETHGMDTLEVCQYVAASAGGNFEDANEIFGLVYDALNDDGVSANVYDFDR